MRTQLGGRAWEMKSHLQCMCSLLLFCCSVLTLNAVAGTWLDKCSTSCNLGLVESIPQDLPYPSGSPSHASTFQAWRDLLTAATSTLDIASYYWTLIGRGDDSDSTDVEGKTIFNDIVSASKRGVKIRIIQNLPTPEMPNFDSQQLSMMGVAEVRNLNFSKLEEGEGILHTKLWIVDGKHFFVGSANMDWRSLTQVKELGVLAMDCECLARDAEQLFAVYWNLTSPTARIPKPWPSQYNAMFNLSHPALISLNSTPALAYWSSSPPNFCAQHRTPDLTALLHVIDSAQTNVSVAVMDYAPAFVYQYPRKFWPTVDDALRRAAYDRGVHVRFLGSVWEHTSPDQIKFLASLAAMSGTGVRGGTIETRLFHVPPVPGKNVPFTRVNHNKYMVTDNAAYITTSNWSADYWECTGGVSLTVNQTSSSPSSSSSSSSSPSPASTLQYQLAQVFERDWNSPYAQDVLDYLKMASSH